jgi:hypothetical protein
MEQICNGPKSIAVDELDGGGQKGDEGRRKWSGEANKWINKAQSWEMPPKVGEIW